MSVAQAQAEISVREYTHWYALYTLEPFGDTAGYLQAAQIQSSIFNVNRGKGTSPVKLQDCILKFTGARTYEDKQEALRRKIEMVLSRATRSLKEPK